MQTDNPSPAHVLLVEDEPLLRELVMENLQDAGYSVFAAGDGTAGVDILRSDTRIDLLLSDIKLPDIVGYEVARIGKKLRPDLKVILMTGYAPSSLPAVLQAQVHCVLQKPFSLNTLPDTVAAALGG
jgi:CheY-like chemotaxis protein